jgi:hypothetical protein
MEASPSLFPSFSFFFLFFNRAHGFDGSLALPVFSPACLSRYEQRDHFLSGGSALFWPRLHQAQGMRTTSVVFCQRNSQRTPSALRAHLSEQDSMEETEERQRKIIHEYAGSGR